MTEFYFVKIASSLNACRSIWPTSTRSGSGLHPGEQAMGHAVCRRDERYRSARFQHRQGLFDGITKNYDVKTLVHFEEPALATMRASTGNLTGEKLSAAP